MLPYFMKFHVSGEVADTLLLREPEPRLLVDISMDSVPVAGPGERPYPNRACFTLTDPLLIEKFRADVTVGDMVEATGCFSQSHYVPHRTSYIDTTFEMSAFQRLDKQADRLTYEGKIVEPALGSLTH